MATAGFAWQKLRNYCLAILFGCDLKEKSANVRLGPKQTNKLYLNFID
jgi:hypothetical protein